MNLLNKKIKKNSKSGFSLAQLMIGGAIMFIISSTAIDLTYGSANDSEKRTLESSLHRDGLFSSILISNDLTRAGDLDYGTSPFTRSPFDWEKTGQYDADNDELAIRFYNHDNVTSCSGENNIGVLTNHYKLVDNQLFCNDVLLLDNVERFNVLFGADLNGDGSINRYVNSNTANTLTTNSKTRIISLRFNLLIKGEKAFGENEEKSFTLVNGENLTYNDNNIYKYFEREVLLRNML